MYILIDNYGILIRYACALMKDMNIQLQKYGGILKYFQLLKALREKYPTATIITFSDLCTNNFRRLIDVNYKQTREKLHDYVLNQISMLMNILKENNITNVYHDNYESDDLIASFVYSHIETTCIVVGNDKDLLQLLQYKNTTIYNPFLKIELTNTYVIEKYGIDSCNFALYQALVGDSSDNIPGISGIGPKTAVRILNKSLNIQEIIFQNVKYDFTNINIYLQLTTLCVNIDLTSFDFVYKNINVDKILKEIYAKIYASS